MRDREKERERSFANLKSFLESEATQKSNLSECLKRHQKTIFKETIESMSQSSLISREQLRELKGHGDKEEIFSRILNKCRLEIKEIREILGEGKENVQEKLLERIDRLSGEEGLSELKKLLQGILSKEDFLTIKLYLIKLEEKLSSEELELVREELQNHLNDIEELSEAVELDEDLEEVKQDILELKKASKSLKEGISKKCVKEKLKLLRELRKMRKETLISLKSDKGDIEVLREILEKIKEAKGQRLSENKKCFQEIVSIKELIRELKEKLGEELSLEEKDQEQGKLECNRPDRVPECVGQEILVEVIDKNGCLSYVCQSQVCPVPKQVDCESYGMKTKYVKDLKGCEKIQCQR